MGLGFDKKWALIANYSEKTQLRNWFSAELSKSVFPSEGWQADYIPVDLTLNGTYLGTYSLATPIRISASRLDLPDIAKPLTDENGDGVTDLRDGGFVLEIDSRQDASHGFVTERGVPIVLKDPDLDQGPKAGSAYTEEEIFRWIQTCVQDLEDTIYADGFADPETGYRSRIDVDSFVQWYLVNELMKSVDATFFSSVFLYFDPADGLFHMGPNWDFDISSGNCSYNDCEFPEGFYVLHSPWISRLFEDPWFVEQVWTEWTDHRDALTDAVNSSIQRKADEIALSAGFNFEKWKNLGIKNWPNPDSAWERKTYQSEIDYMVDWLNARAAWLDTALADLRTAAEAP